MDIEYLLALQNLRESLPSLVENIFVGLSFIGDGPALIAIAFIVYWCISKRAGLFSLTAFSAGNLVNQFIKNIACVYRPWIRDTRIIPAEAAIEGAGGYSFPSGHTTGTGTILGSFAWLCRKKHKLITVICVIVILLIAFSRNFLGVHTPQDVLVALLEAIIAIACTQAFFNWIDRYDALMPGHRMDILAVSIVFIVCIVTVAIVALKPYPIAYADGVALIDVEKMQKGSFEAAGIIAGLAVGWLLERRYIDFITDDLATRDRIIRGIVGVALVGITYIATDIVFKAILPYVWAKLAAMFIVVVVGTFIAPLAFSAIERRIGQTHE